MANTRQSAKRARQNVKRQARNQMQRSKTKSAVKLAIDAIASKKTDGAKDTYVNAVKALSKAASRGVIPARRASRKIARLTKLAKKAMPAALNFKN